MSQQKTKNPKHKAITSVFLDYKETQEPREGLSRPYQKTMTQNHEKREVDTDKLQIANGNLTEGNQELKNEKVFLSETKEQERE